MTDLQLGVVGCAGRMGINLLRQIAATEGCAIVGGSERPGHDDLGRDLGELAGLGELGLAVEADPKPMFERAAVVLDFTVPAASVAHAALAVETKTNLVIGTTGMTADDDAAVNKAAETIAIMREGNMSLGVNVLALVAKQVASLLDDDFDIEVVEMHHRYKVDAPSGTALRWGVRRRRAEAWTTTRLPPAAVTASPESGTAARSATPPCAAATWPANIRSSSRQMTSAWN